MPDATRIDLSKYRLEKAEAVLETAKRLLNDEDYKKHSAVIARFSEKYLKTNKLPREYGKLVSNASRIRKHLRKQRILNK